MTIINQKLDDSLLAGDINIVYRKFLLHYKSLLDKYFPRVKMSRKKFKDKAWITEGIKTSIKHRNLLFKKYHANKNVLNEDKWKAYRNRLLIVIREAESSYYQNLITKHNNNCNAMWKIFGKIIKGKSSRSKITKLLF